MNRLEGKVALVTGAGRGQGRAHADRLAAEGADIVAIDICDDTLGWLPYSLATDADLAETARAVEKHGRRALTIRADVREHDAMRAAAAAAIDAFGRIDTVCANAGIGGYGHSWELQPDEWRQMIDVNLTGVWNTTSATIPHMIAAGRGGSLILTSSTAGLVPIPHGSHYSAAKAGVVALMKSLAQELGPHFIRANSIHPTGVDTRLIHNDATYRLFRPDLENPTREDVAPRFCEQNVIPVPWLDPAEVSNAVAFLACDESRYITGCCLTVDCGVTAKYPVLGA